MFPANHALARIFSEMAAMYRYMGSSERFREVAYARAARTIDNFSEDIIQFAQTKNPDDIPGVGESIAVKIKEYIRTGAVALHHELKKQVPYELLDLMNITGLGPQTLKNIHKNLKINTKEEFIQALESGKIAGLPGFGLKKTDNIRRSLKLWKENGERMLLHHARQLGENILRELKSIRGIMKAEVAGSLRRKKETIGDIDILVACQPLARQRVMDLIMALTFVKKILARGDTKASFIMADFDRQVDIRIVNPEEWGAALLYFTGSKEHNIHLRTLARDRGWKINEYGVFDLKNNRCIAGKTEEEIYNLFDFQFIPPELRENRDEFELASDHAIPRLIEPEDIRGDLHIHSKYSDGNSGIPELAKYARQNLDYEYLVITDHSKSERVAGGMDEAGFEKQMKEIDALNAELGKKFIKKGVEADILSDGTPDLSDDLLSEMDWVCASIHSGFSHDNTERLIKACHHPHVHCIAHPAGRLIGKRSGYPVDWKRVFEAAAETGTAMEINAQPDRMDLTDELARQAREAGVKLVISTDSHMPENMAFMEEGVAIARRAGCTKEDILNTRSWKELAEFSSRKKEAVKGNFFSNLFR